MPNSWRLIAILAGLAILVLWVLYRSRGDLSSGEARELVANGAVLVDVRTPTEYRSAHIDGARNVPLAELPQRLDELRGKSLVLYCRSGNRSHKAQQLLEAQGFSQVRNLGAMSRW